MTPPPTAPDLKLHLWPGLGAVEEWGPAIYRDQHGHIHVDLGVVLRDLYHVADTPANRERVARHLAPAISRALLTFTPARP